MRLRPPLPTPQASHRESKRVVDVVQLKAEAVLEVQVVMVFILQMLHFQV